MLSLTRIGIIFEQNFTSLHRIYGIIYACSGVAIVSMVLVLALPNSSATLWFAFTLYGLAIGPGSGLFFDLANRFTYTTNISSTILMLGINLGANFAPYMASALWDYTALGPSGLIVTLLVLMVLPIPSAAVIPFIKYQKI